MRLTTPHASLSPLFWESARQDGKLGRKQELLERCLALARQVISS
jgi:hypothetical protein